MEANKQKSEELEVQEQAKKAWVKPEMKNLDVDSGFTRLTIEINGYFHPS